MRAIIAPYDKTGAVELARGLTELGAEVFSTSGSQRHLAEAGVAARAISELTGFPEILDGRVKTLHPAVHGGILARRDQPGHMRELEEHGLGTIDLVAVNLYPFVETIAQPDVKVEDALEQIDIGGPTMLRAAAKNFPHVLPLVDPADYELTLEALRSGGVSLEARQRLAAKAFQHVALYDTAIASYLRAGEAGFPEAVTVGLRKRFDLRYGENPHQQAAFYVSDGPGEARGVAAAEQLHGKQLSYVNILDADAAWNAACDLEGPAVAIVKHLNPCGLATHEDVVEAFRRAFAGDPISAFGGIVAVNRPVGVELAREIRATKHETSGQRLLLEIILAADFDDEALALLEKSKNLRILRTPLITEADRFEFRQVVGGMLMQSPDSVADDDVELKFVTQRAPTDEEQAVLAEYLAKHSKDRIEALGNVAWALLVSTEFCINH